jgi:DNA helicase HerA-like ATPase
MIGSVGVIFGETGSHTFRFAVTDPADVKRTDYVKVWHPTDGWVLGQILSMSRTANNDNKDRLVAIVSVIGARDPGGLLRSPRTPFRPGDKIYKAEEDVIVDTLGLSEGGAYLGVLDGTDIPVTVDRNKLIQKHCSILAMTGSGKSYTAAVIMEEMMEREVPLLIIDPHGEYATLKEPNDDPDMDALSEKFDIEPYGYDNVYIYTPGNKKVCEYADRTLRLNGLNLKPKEIIEYVPSELNNTEIGLIYEAVNALKHDNINYTIKDVLVEIGSSHSNTKWGVYNKLEPLLESEFLSDKPTPLVELFTRGRTSIIDMKGIHPDVQQTIVSKLLSGLFEARKAGLVPPGMVVVEEAHNFCPEKGFSKTACSDVLRAIASEGRKFGLGLLIISQRPAKVDKNVLSQCNTQIIMRVTNPNDIRAITKSLEGISTELEEEIKRLPPGVAMLVSPDIPRAVMVQVRTRKSKHGGASKEISEDIESEELDYEDEEEETEETVRPSVSGSIFRKIFGRG